MENNLKNQLPDEVKVIFEIFNAAQNDSIRLVGGCVRDLIIDKKLKDFDFATKFLPQETIQILEKNNVKAIPTGVKYGTITAIINSKNFEITTLRKDVENDGRHPKTEFVDDYLSDAKRRDFTINALYLDQDGKIYDYFNGISDLKNSEVKFIGDPNQRIQEDYLRILRFFRFSIFYAKNLDENGLQNCIKNKSGLSQLSSDRIRDEFFKFFEQPKSEKLLKTLQTFENSQLRSQIFPTKFQINNLEKLLFLEKNIEENLSKNIKFAALTFTPNLDLKEIATKLNFSNNDKKYFLNLHRLFFTKTSKSLKYLLSFEEKNLVRDFYILSQLKNENFEQKTFSQNLNFIDNFEMPIFPLNGDDLLQIGLSGAKIGEILLKAKEIWIESDFLKNKEELIESVGQC